MMFRALAALTLCLSTASQAGIVSSMLAAPKPGQQGAQVLNAKPSPLPPQPEISALLKPEALRRIVEQREIVTNASLDDIEGSSDRHYSFYASMLVHASLARARELLTDYRAYARMIPYVDKAEFIHAPDLVLVEGGIWMYKLRSRVLFEDRGQRWIHFRIVGGHFKGLQGDLLFENLGEKGTLVYMRGEQRAAEFPPKWVIEKGAEIVFAFTAKRMRSYVEENDHGRPTTAPSGDPGVPQPRSHL